MVLGVTVVLKITNYTKYSGVDDVEQKKKVLGVLNGSFFSNLVGGGFLKKSLGNHWLD